MQHTIHIFGASGCGTTTLGAAVAEKLALPHFDVDDFYWRPTDPPFVEKYQPAQRIADLDAAMTKSQGWVFSGSLCGWGDGLIPRFSAAVFLAMGPKQRLRRLLRRERQRHGDRILPGGDMHKIHTDFMTWAGRYESAGMEQRSRVLHQRWLHLLHCPLLQLDGALPTDDLVRRVITAL